MIDLYFDVLQFLLIAKKPPVVSSLPGFQQSIQRGNEEKPGRRNFIKTAGLGWHFTLHGHIGEKMTRLHWKYLLQCYQQSGDRSINVGSVQVWLSM